MREILFRGKRQDNEKWIEGFYVHNTYSIGFAEQPTIYEKEKLTKFAERLVEKLKENVNGENVDMFVECKKLLDETLKEIINE